MSFANTWAEEKRKYGIVSDTKDTYLALKSFRTLKNKIIGLFQNHTHAKMYDTIKEKVPYKDFKKKMIQVVKKRQEDANKNVQKVKAEIMKKIDDPAVLNALRTHLQKEGKNFGIKNKREKELENAFIERADEFLSKFHMKHWLKRGEDDKQLIKKYEKELNMLDMYWPRMKERERMMALGSLYDYYTSRKKLLKKR